MRKEILWFFSLILLLVAVFYTQKELKNIAKNPGSTEFLPFSEDDATKDGEGERGDEEGGDIGAVSAAAASQMAREEAQAAHELILKSMLQAREGFRRKAEFAAASDEDLHHGPPVLREAADQFGSIAELETQYPEEAAQFSEFYITCARDDQALTAIRVQCLNRYLKKAGLSEQATQKLLSELPEYVTRLYKAL